MSANATSDGKSALPALHKTAQEFLKHTYEFIICGGGTAGLIVAARLTENPNINVGVLEAGENRLDDPLVDSPVAFPQMYNRPEYDWRIKTVPQENNVNRVHHIPRGKVLGGSSAINLMMYVRGSLRDYDDWAILAEDEGWNAENMMKYMRKHETMEPLEDGVVDRSSFPSIAEYHGTSGPTRTSFNDFRVPIEDDFIRACEEVTGVKEKPRDPWSGDHIGFYNTLGTVSRAPGPLKGKRSYTARGYFEANAHRPNLHVLCNAHVTGVELEGNKAVGVSFVHSGDKHRSGVEKEVIVSGGAIHSPAILEMSGIGDPQVLQRAGVEVKVANKAVGENVQDHLLTAACWEVKPDVMTLEAIYDPPVMDMAMKQLQETGGGPLTSVCSMQGFFPYKLFATQEEQDIVIASIQNDLKTSTPFQRKQLERIIEHLKSDTSANLQFILVPSTFGMAKGVEDQSQVWPAPKSPGQPGGVSVGPGLQYPVSRGYVHIKSADPFDPPTVDPAFLKHPSDVAVLAAGLKMAGKLEHSPHLSSKLSTRLFPPASADMTDTEAMRKCVKDLIMSEYHICGSVAMGDAMDSRLRVHGTRNLRVIDASAFPGHVSGNICASVMALAEKGADLIKQDWGF